MDKKVIVAVAVGVLVGVVAAPKLRSLPVISKLPTA